MIEYLSLRQSKRYIAVPAKYMDTRIALSHDSDRVEIVIAEVRPRTDWKNQGIQKPILDGNVAFVHHLHAFFEIFDPLVGILRHSPVAACVGKQDCVSLPGHVNQHLPTVFQIK